jgi:membrane protein DedA with SNARE-associated domain
VIAAIAIAIVVAAALGVLLMAAALYAVGRRANDLNRRVQQLERWARGEAHK